MTSYSVSRLFVYPVKSLRGIELQSAHLDHFGIAGDRRWMLVDSNNKFVTQRQIHKLCLVDVQIKQNVLVVSVPSMNPIVIDPLQCQSKPIQVQVWNDRCDATPAAHEVNQWFSDFVKTKVSLVYMNDQAFRPIDPKYATAHTDQVSFADGFPLLIIGEGSLADLNQRLIDKNKSPVPIERFRPNIVVADTPPFEEDQWQQVQIGDLAFKVVKPCSRCIIPTIDIQSGSRSDEPIKTLREYRQREDMKIYFGQNAIHQAEGRVNVGDFVSIISP